MRHGLVLLDAVEIPAAGRGDQQSRIEDQRAREEHPGRRERPRERRGVHRSQDGAGGRSALARGGRGRVMPRIRPHHAELEVAHLAGRHRELERPTRPQSLRPHVRPVGRRISAAIAGATEFSRQRRRQPGGLDAALAEPQGSARGEIRERLLGLPLGRMPGVPVERHVHRRVRLVVQARGQAALSDAGHAFRSRRPRSRRRRTTSISIPR